VMNYGRVGPGVPKDRHARAERGQARGRAARLPPE
jgi:hypothetical protein